MGLWLRVGGEPVDYSAVGSQIATLHYIELEEQGGPTLELLTTPKAVSMMRQFAAYAFLVRRHQGETLTWRQAAAELRLADFLGYGDAPAEAPADPPSAPQDGAAEAEAAGDPGKSEGSEPTSTTA